MVATVRRARPEKHGKRVAATVRRAQLKKT